MYSLYCIGIEIEPISIADLDELAPNEFLGPFLDVIRSEDTTGPITGLALSSVNKFLSYRLIGRVTFQTTVGKQKNYKSTPFHTFTVAV